MSLYAPESGKKFAKPATGKYIGTIIDVVDLGLKAPKNTNPAFSSEPVHRIQVTWTLNTPDGKPFLGEDGKPVEYSEAPPFKMGEGGGQFKPTRLFTVASGVFQGAPPRPFDAELLLGRSNELFIVKTGDGDQARSEIVGFLPVPPGVTPPTAPAGFVRKINKPATQTAAPAVPAQSTAAPAQSKEVSF